MLWESGSMADRSYIVNKGELTLKDLDVFSNRSGMKNMLSERA